MSTQLTLFGADPATSDAEHSPRSAAQRRLRASRLVWLTRHPLRVLALLVALAALVSPYLRPTTTEAIPIVTPITDALDPVNWVEKGFVGLLNFLFGDTVDKLSGSFIAALLNVPDLATSPAFGDLRAFHDYLAAAGWALLTLSFVAAALIYWASSYTTSGAQQAATAFVRTVGAVGLLLSFPYLFGVATSGVNYLTGGIIQAPVVKDSLGDLIRSTLTAGFASGGGLALIVGVVAVVLALMLLVIKIISAALLATLYCLSPLAIGLWPVEQLSWLLRTLAQVMFVVLVFPVIWAVCFGVFALIAHPQLLGGGNVVATLGGPLFRSLVGVAALCMAFKLPFALLRQATGAGLVPSVSRGMGAAYHARSLVGLGR